MSPALIEALLEVHARAQAAGPEAHWNHPVWWVKKP